MEYNAAPIQAPGTGIGKDFWILLLKAAVLILIIMWGIHYFLKKPKPPVKVETEDEP